MDCELNVQLVSLYPKSLEQDNGHFFVLVQRSDLLSVKMVHKVNGTGW